MTGVEQSAPFHSASVAERFWVKVDRRAPDECWPWLGGRGSTGNAYGRFSQSHGVPRPAHQVAWEIANNAPFPAGKLGCHSCDNPSCVNPAHIWPGTQSENVRDCVAKGRNHDLTRTHCTRGHELTDANRAPVVGQVGRCRICAREYSKAYMRKVREKRRAAGG